MKDFGKYVRLDSWADVEVLGLSEKFIGFTSDDPNPPPGRRLGEICRGDDVGKFPFLKSDLEWLHAYIPKSSIKAKSTELMEFIDDLKEIIEDIED